MPRKPKTIEPIVNVNKFEFLTKYMQVRMSAFNEFIREFQNAPLVRFHYNAADHTVVNYIVCFMQHFPFTIYRYYNTAGVGTGVEDYSLPVRPLYAKLNVNDFRAFTFWQNSGGSGIPPRNFEPIDFQADIFDDVGSPYVKCFDYCQSVYLDRKQNKWKGLDAICIYNTIEENIGPEMADFVHIHDLIVDPDDPTHDVQDLFQFWIKMKERYEGYNMFGPVEQLLLPDVVSGPSPEEPTFIIDPAQEFEIIDNRSERWLEYDVEGHIIGFKDFKSLELTESQIWLYYDITFIQVKGILYIASIPQTFTGVKILGDQIQLLATFENWIKYKMYIPIPDIDSPEWFKGNFPKTEYCHMAFYGGHSFYIPDGYTIDANITRLTKSAGYISVKFVTDVFNIKLFHIPMRFIVAYGKWMEYPEPAKQSLINAMRDQWYSLSSKWGSIHIVETKEALIALGKSGTIYSSFVPGITNITSMVATGGSMR